MGIASILLGRAAAGIALAVIGGLVLRTITKHITLGAKRGRAKAITIATFFPAACVFWTGVIFLFQAFISQNILHRDLGIGTTWSCSLPNGYALMMVDVTDRGWIYKPESVPLDTNDDSPDTVANVRAVQVTERYILGAADSRASEHAQDKNNQVDSFFLLDTQSGRHMTFVRYQALAFQAQQLGIKANLEPINTVYLRYRSSWIDVAAELLYVLPPLAGMYLLATWIARARKSRPAAIQAASRRKPIPALLAALLPTERRRDSR